MTCKNICARYQVIKPKNNLGRYETGQKRCQICEIFIQWSGRFCPCCGYRLRNKPRNKKFKEQLRNNKPRAIPKEFERITIEQEVKKQGRQTFKTLFSIQFVDSLKENQSFDLLAEQIWKDALSYLILKCKKCGNYSFADCFIFEDAERGTARFLCTVCWSVVSGQGERSK